MADQTFVDWLAEHRNGGLALELDEAWKAVNRGVGEHHKVGSLTLKLQVKPTDVQSGVHVHDDVTGKIPEATRQAAFYFADDEGALHRNDPRQMEFGELKEVAEPPAPRDLGANVDE